MKKIDFEIVKGVAVFVVGFILILSLYTVIYGAAMTLLVNVLLHGLFGIARISFLRACGYGVILAFVTETFIKVKNSNKKD